MTAVLLLIGAAVFIWLGQTVLLLLAGMPVRSRVDADGMSKAMLQANRIIANIAILSVLMAYPLLRGVQPHVYYYNLLPLDPRALGGLRGFCMGTFLLAGLYLAWVMTDNLRFRVRHSPQRLAKRLAVVPLSTLLGALVEELLFRGVVVADLLRTVGAPEAVALGAILFAAAHYLRRVKRYWTFGGHLALGLLLCTAFTCTGTLWLPLGLHAGGILMTLGVRPFVRYIGPPWMIGASIFPYAGIVGVMALLLLTAMILLFKGGVM